VSMRCGHKGGTDGRSRRTQFVRDLQAIDRGLVDAYGGCAQNTPWPTGFKRDKHHVMSNHKFCIAIDNSVDDDYVTEKLWDCLAAGAVPIYRGAHNADKYLPHGRQSAIFIDDFSSVKDLAKHLQKVGSDKALWESYRRWTREAPSPEWTALMKVVDMRNVKCNLCTKLSQTHPRATSCLSETRKDVDSRKAASKIASMVVQPTVPPTEAPTETPMAPPTKLTVAQHPSTKVPGAPPTAQPDKGGAPTGVAESAAESEPTLVEEIEVSAPVKEWSVDKVAEWLTGLGFEATSFRDNFVDGKLLVELDDEMLKDDLGISSKLQRKRLLLAIGELM